MNTEILGQEPTKSAELSMELLEQLAQSPRTNILVNSIQPEILQ